MRPSIQGMIFDLDGTLIDSLQDIASAMNRTLRAFGYPEHDLASYRYFVGDGIRKLVERSIPESERGDDLIDRVLADYQQDYRDHWRDVTQPYPGIPEMLDGMIRRGLPMAVFSNKPHDLTRQCVEALLEPWPFDPVEGQKPDVPRKPDPAGAMAIAAQWKMNPETIAFVGDTATDMLTATGAGMFALGVTWGFRTESELRENGADLICHQPAEILAAVDVVDRRG